MFMDIYMPPVLEVGGGAILRVPNGKIIRNF
jgi:hypothetical protein